MHCQVKYVVEFAKALAQHPAVFRVDLLTRLIADPLVDKEYGQPEECLIGSEQGSLGGAYIARLPCGKPSDYIRCRAGSSSPPISQDMASSVQGGVLSVCQQIMLQYKLMLIVGAAALSQLACSSSLTQHGITKHVLVTGLRAQEGAVMATLARIC